ARASGLPGGGPVRGDRAPVTFLDSILGRPPHIQRTAGPPAAADAPPAVRDRTAGTRRMVGPYDRRRRIDGLRSRSAQRAARLLRERLHRDAQPAASAAAADAAGAVGSGCTRYFAITRSYSHSTTAATPDIFAPRRAAPTPR